jgi:uncharacterized protein YjbJ (UPF0337 family)
MEQTEKATEQHCTPEMFAQQWSHLRGKINQWWDRLTDADLEQIAGSKAQLIRLLQTRYGYAQERAEQEVDRRLREFSSMTRGSEGGGLGQTVTAAAQGVTSSVAGTAGEVGTKVQGMATEVGTKVQGMATKAATAVAETATRAGAHLPGLPGEVEGFIRRYPLPSLLAGLGLGFLLARLFGQGWPGGSKEEGSGHAEAGFPDAVIQCPQCGQMLRQADMVHHSAVCGGTGLPGHGGSTA